MAIIEVFRLFGTISINKAKAIADLRAVEASARANSGRIGGFFKTLGKIALATFAAISAAGAGIFVAAIRKAAEFEEAMAKVVAITGATGDEFEALTDKAKQLGRDTKFTMTEIAAGMESLGRAGFATNEIIDAMDGVTALASATMMDLGRSSEITANRIRAFGLEAADADRVVNVLAATAASSNTTVESLSESFKYFAPVARTFGIAIEEAAAFIGKLGDNGLTGTLATRTLATAMMNLADPTEEQAALMERLNIEFFNAEGKFVGLVPMIENLETAFADLTPQQRMAAESTLFGAQAVKQMDAILAVGSETLATYTGSLTGTNAAYDQMETQLDTLSGQWTILKGSMDLLLVTIGQDLTPLLKSFLEDRIIPLVNGITNWIEEQGGIVKAMGALKDKIYESVPFLETLVEWITKLFTFIRDNKNDVVMGLTALAGALAAIKAVKFVSALTGIVGGLSSFGALLSPGGLLLVGLGLLAVGVKAARDRITEYTTAQREAVEAAKDMEASMSELTNSAEDLEKAGAILQGAINLVGSELAALVSKGELSQITLKQITDKMGELRAETLKLDVDQMASAWEAGVKAILAEYEEIVPGITAIMGDAAAAGTEVGEAMAEGLADGIRRGAPLAEAAIADLNADLEAKLAGDWEIRSPSKKTFWYGLMLMLGLAKGVREGAPEALDAIDNFNAEAEGSFDSTFGSIELDVKSSMGGILHDVVTGTASLREAVGSAMIGLKDSILDSGIDTSVDWVVDSFWSMVSSVSSASVTISGLVAGIAQTVGPLVPLAIGLSSTVSDWVSRANQALTGFFSSIGLGSPTYGGGTWRIVDGERIPITSSRDGNLFTGPALTVIGEGKSDEVALPLTDNVYQRLGTAIARAIPPVSLPTYPPLSLATAGSGPVPSRLPAPAGDVHIHFDGTVVREEADIRKIAEQTFTLWKQTMRGRGRG